MACLLLQVHWDHSVRLRYNQHCCIACTRYEVVQHSTDILTWQKLAAGTCQGKHIQADGV